MNECNIIRDLLPLYAEELTSPDSGEFIEKHLASCAQCRDTWRRCREELPKMEVAEDMVENYQKGLRRDKWKMTLRTSCAWILVAVITVGIFFYCGWENGDYARGKMYSAPDGIRSVELVDLDGAGFFGNEGSILKFRFERGYVNRYAVDWQDLTVYWAPDSQTMLLVIQNGAGETELRIVDHRGGLPGGGTREIPGLIPSETEPDLTQVLKEMCAEQDVTVSGFEFAEWSDDSRYLYFRYQTEAGTGWLEYDMDTGNAKLCDVVRTIDIPVVPTADAK